MAFETLIDSIHTEGAMSQIFDLCPSFNLMSRKREDLGDFFICNFLTFISKASYIMYCVEKLVFQTYDNLAK